METRRSVGSEKSEAAGHLLAELDLVRDDLVHGRTTVESARARITIIRARARSASESAMNRSFAQLTMQWETIMADAENLKRAYLLMNQPSEPEALPC